MITFFTEGFDIADAEKWDRTSTQTCSFRSSKYFYRDFYNLMTFHQSSYSTANFAETLESKFIVIPAELAQKSQYLFTMINIESGKVSDNLQTNLDKWNMKLKKFCIYPVFS